VPMPTTGNNINYAQLNNNKPLNEWIVNKP
jgi:penicillin-binding protein 1A